MTKTQFILLCNELLIEPSIALENDNIVQKVENSGENPQHLTEIGSNLYYSANSNQGREPWVIEPNKPAKQLQDINPGIKSSNPKNFQSYLIT